MKRILITTVLAAALILTGCQTVKTNNDGTLAETAAVTQAVTEATAAVTEAAVTTAAATTKAAREKLLPLTENTTGKVQIQTVSGSVTYKYNSYIITSAGGETVIVDPTEMPDKDLIDLSPAAIVNTHAHGDHNDLAYSDSYDCQKLPYIAGDISTEDFHIYTVASSHSGDTIKDPADNYIIVFEVDGLRIAHMGDIGQETLTDEQLEAIGPIDIAFMQFDNSYSSMSLKNMKGFNLIEQLNPKIIIPTHYAKADLPLFDEKYGGSTEAENVLAISAEDLPEDTMHVYLITNTHYYR